MVRTDPDGERRIHVHPVRVYYEDTDAFGVVYYANYLKYAERARTEMMRGLGYENSGLMADGLAFAVRHCTVDYIKPALLDDHLDVHTRMLEVGGATLRAEQIVRRNGDDLARMEIRLACIKRSGRPGRIPKDLRASLAALTT